MKKIFVAVFALIGAQGCDLSPPGLLGSEKRWPTRERLEPVPVVTPPRHLRECKEIPELHFVSSQACTSDRNALWDKGYWAEEVSVDPMGDRVLVRVEIQNERETTKRLLADLHRFEYRNTQTGEILRFACTPMLEDTFSCVPKCVLAAENQESANSKDCIALPENVRIAKNGEGKGLFAMYRYGARSPDCPEEETVFGDLPGGALSGAPFCDGLTHERELGFGGAEIPSLDLEIRP